MSSGSEQRSTHGRAANGKGHLLHGDFDVESLLSELTVEEKASLLSGMNLVYNVPMCIMLTCGQGRTSGILKKFPDSRSLQYAHPMDPMASEAHTSSPARLQLACHVALPLVQHSTQSLSTALAISSPMKRRRRVPTWC